MIGKEGARISERKGGLGVPNLVLREAGTKKVVFDNRDVTAMAKQNVLRGGITVDNILQSGKAKKDFYTAMREKYWEREWQCPSCKNTFWRIKGCVEIGQLTQAGTRVNRCISCWQDSEPTGWKDGEEEEYLKIKPYIDRWLEAKTESAELEVLKEFLESVNETIPDAFK